MQYCVNLASASDWVLPPLAMKIAPTTTPTTPTAATPKPAPRTGVMNLLSAWSLVGPPRPPSGLSEALAGTPPGSASGTTSLSSFFSPSPSCTAPFTGLPPTGKTTISVPARIDGAVDADQRQGHRLIVHLHGHRLLADAVEHDAQRGDLRLDGGELLPGGGLRVLERGRRRGGELLAGQLEEGLLRPDELAQPDLGAGDEQEVGGRVDDGLGPGDEVDGLGVLLVVERLGARVARERAAAFSSSLWAKASPAVASSDADSARASAARPRR